MLTRSCVAVQSFIKPHARKLIAMILSMFSMFKRLALRSQRQCENRLENETQTPLKTHRLDGLLESLAKGLIMTGQNLNASKNIGPVLGPVLIAVNISEITHFDIWAESYPPLVYLNGVILFVIGVALLRVHNHWLLMRVRPGHELESLSFLRRIKMVSCKAFT